MLQGPRVKIALKSLNLLLFASVMTYYLILANLTSTYTKRSLMPAVSASIIGILFTIEFILIEPLDLTYQLRLKKFLKVIVVGSVLCAFVTIICKGAAVSIPSMAIALLWLMPLGLIIYCLFRKKESASLIESMVSNELEMSPEISENRSKLQVNLFKMQTKSGKCKCCIFWFLFIFVFCLTFLFTLFSIMESYRHNHYEVIGQLYSVPIYPISNPKGPTHRLRIYCEGESNGKSIFLLEHGGGSNGIAFTGLQALLTQKGRRSCSYDRSGYGRSQNGPGDITPQENAQKTFELLKKAGQTGPYVILGWSAGTQISQNVTGLIFLDGYPNYQKLIALNKNLTESYVTSSKTSLLYLLNFLRGVEPFGFGEIAGSAKDFKPESMASYYSGYYRNMDFWDSQYRDIHNPNDITQWLTKLGDQDNSTRPYDKGTVSLNWPRIKVPLLLLPAKTTFQQNLTTNMYYIQYQKYIETALNTTTMVILDGQHGVAYQNPEIVVQAMLNSFK